MTEFLHDSTESQDDFFDFAVDVDTSTLFALGEYTQDHRTHLSQAVHDLAILGLMSLDNTITDEYPTGELPYESAAVDESIFEKSRISVKLPVLMRHAFEALCEQYGLDEAALFAKLVDEGRQLRIKHKKGAVLSVVESDGSATKLVLFKEDRI